jgi:3-oxoacyl-[acyl-carrier-protein] synthase II
MSLSAKRRVVVTGLGLVSPLGLGVKENWKNIIEGNCKAVKLNGEGT